ncbi:hypothetical protein [Burkholderia gladioli]|uniref:hypothetical protein n=1 Tax=Burkholderia gladioli TaxID=28095 RepID=UPI00163E620F|nr:hypothetical protein [Burkholderia gladioli]
MKQLYAKLVLLLIGPALRQHGQPVVSAPAVVAAEIEATIAGNLRRGRGDLARVLRSVGATTRSADRDRGDAASVMRDDAKVVDYCFDSGTKVSINVTGLSEMRDDVRSRLDVVMQECASRVRQEISRAV